MTQHNEWETAQKWEKAWHGNCVNKVGGELHQVQTIAPRIGLHRISSIKGEHVFDLKGKSVLDIGGGAASLLLKCINVKGTVVDPIKFPDWVYARYDCAGIRWEIKKGEDIDETGYDEVWLYNVLQHTEDPQKVIENARSTGKVIRIFEYVNIPTCEGHIHTLKEQELNKWLGGEGKVEDGKRYYGIFPTNINTRGYWNSIYGREGKKTWRQYSELHQCVLDLIGDPGTFLELGCGVGVFAGKLREKLPQMQYLGLDISSTAVRIMREAGFEAEVADLPPTGMEGRFDLVLGLELLEHLDSGPRVVLLGEVSRMCKRAIFTVPNMCMPPEELAEHRVMYDKLSFMCFLELFFKNVDVTIVDNFLVADCKNHE